MSIIFKSSLLYNKLKLLRRQFSASALYVTGDKASTNFVVLTPYIDFEERLQHKSELLENIRLRKADINLEQVEKHWDFYKHLQEQCNILEQTKAAIGGELSQLMKESERDEKAISKLRVHAKLVKGDHKNLRDFLYGVEETAALNALSLPNVLDKRTPCDGEVLVHSFSERPTIEGSPPPCHFDIARNNDWIEFVNPTCVFLKNEAALFEFALTNYIHDCLIDASFTQYSNASFVRSVIVEGCGTDHLDPREIFTLEKDGSDETINHLHLVGGATLYSFMAYFTKFLLQLGYLPVKLFASGRQYRPVKSEERSLFNLEQASATEIFVITRNEREDLNAEFESAVTTAIKIYENLGCHFRMVYLPANELKRYESLRLSIQMYSAHSQRYVEVGHLSLCDNFLSKRLLVTYNENGQRKYPKVISGTLLNVHKLLACVLECNVTINGGCLLSDLLKRYIS